MTALGISEGVGALKGHDFSRAENTAISTWALAPEGNCRSRFYGGAVRLIHSIALIAGAELILVAGSYAAPPVKKHAPDFKLTISTEDKVFKAQKDMDISVSVKEKNVSNHPVEISRGDDPGDWYKMAVLLDGSPAPITERYRQLMTPQKYDPNAALIGGGMSGTIQAGKATTFGVPLTAFFDLHSPGKYKISFSRDTDPGQPDNVNFKSNTIIITVLPTEAQ